MDGKGSSDLYPDAYPLKTENCEAASEGRLQRRRRVWSTRWMKSGWGPLVCSEQADRRPQGGCSSSQAAELSAVPLLTGHQRMVWSCVRAGAAGG